LTGSPATAPGARVVSPANELVITGTLVEAPQKRTTPAGIPITRFILEHRSEQREAGQARRVECRMRVVAAGSPLADTGAALVRGAQVRVRGFLTRAGYRAPELKTELHALAIEPVELES